MTDLFAKVKDFATNSNSNKVSALQDEKQKMFEFIGMEIYSMYVSGKLAINEIAPFCSRIAEIDAMKHEVACMCGAKLGADVRFCPACGTDEAVIRGNLSAAAHYPQGNYPGYAYPPQGYVHPQAYAAYPQQGYAHPQAYPTQQGYAHPPQPQMYPASPPPQTVQKTCAYCDTLFPIGAELCSGCGRMP
ncbi:MAG: hypothetical protein FWC70_11475 [Defluviitaleaceae bacterium]|nr:hypothetical protein [Defluviitaleaceae bacterium]